MSAGFAMPAALVAPTLPLQQAELARWTRFGEKGGIGKGVALRDRLAESVDELMFLANEELTILLLIDPTETVGLSENLRQERGLALAFCEEVVGIVRISDVKLTTKLKRPIVSGHKKQPSKSLTIDPTFGSPTQSDESHGSPQQSSNNVLSPAMSSSASSASFASSLHSASTLATSTGSHSPHASEDSSDLGGQTVFQGHAAKEAVVPSYFDIPRDAGRHEASPSISSSIDTPGIDRLLDAYVKDEAPELPRMPADGLDRPRERPVGLAVSETEMSRTSALFAAESLGRLLLDDDISMVSGSSGTLSPQYEQKPAPARLLDPPWAPEERVASARQESGMRLSYANLAPLRMSRPPPIAMGELSTQKPSTERPPGAPPLAQLRSPTLRMHDLPDAQHSLRNVSPAFSESLAQRPMPSRQTPPAPVQVATAHLAAMSMSEQSPATPLSSSSASASSPRPSLSPLVPVAPSATSGAMATLSFRTPSNASQSSPISRSPSSATAESPTLGKKGSFKAKSIRSKRRSGSSSASSIRPSVDAPNVQRVGNIEFEFVTTSNVPPSRRSSDSIDSVRRSAEEEVLDSQAVLQSSPVQLRALRASKLIGSPASDTERDAFYQSSLAQSTDSLASAHVPERGASLQDVASPVASPADFKSIESHRTRELKWVQLLATPAASAKKGKKLKAMVRNGIVASVRGKAWLWLAEAASLRQVGLYHALCNKDSPVHDEIEASIAQCVPPHSLFASSDSPARIDLLSVVKAFACQEPAIGFNPALAYVAGVLLLQCPAEDVFWLLVSITRRLLPGFYNADQLVMREFAFVSGHLLAEEQPEIVKKLSDAKIHPHEWTMAWMAPLFCKCLSFESLLRVLDCFFLEGPKVLHRVCLGMFELMKPAIMASPPERMLELIEAPVGWKLSAPHELLAASFAIKVKDGQLRRLQRKAEILIRQTK